MPKYLIITLFLLFSVTVTSQANMCTHYLISEGLIHKNQVQSTGVVVKKEASIILLEFESIKRSIPFHRKSSDLTKLEKDLIRNKIKKIRSVLDDFNQSYNLLFSKYGTDFLSELRAEFETQELFLRQKSQIIINELNRFLDQNGDLLFRDLDLIPAIRSISQSWAIRFMDHPDQVYFNLSFYITSRLYDGSTHQGYIFSKEGDDRLKAPVFVLEDIKAALEDQELTYPGSHVSIPKTLDGLVFPGLPLKSDIIEFLAKHGNKKGRIQVAALPHFISSNSVLSVFRQEKRLPIFDSRWSNLQKNYFSIYNEDGTLNLDLSNLANYFEERGELIIPTIPVVWHEQSKTIFKMDDNKRRKSLTAIDAKHAEFTVAPTQFEFITAFIELLQI